MTKTRQPEAVDVENMNMMGGHVTCTYIVGNQAKRYYIYDDNMKVSLR